MLKIDKLKDKVEKNIQAALTEFDFQKLHKAMAAMEWSWCSAPNQTAPDPEHLKNESERLLQSAFRRWTPGKKSGCDSGGFSTEISRKGHVYIAFTIDAVWTKEMEVDHEYLDLSELLQ